MLKQSDYTYTPRFCEENIWKLIESAQQRKDIIPRHVIFIINHHASVAIYHQKIHPPHEPTIWDYHVILHAEVDEQPVILDFDSHCQFPCPINEYFALSFPVWDQLYERYRPYLRCVDASDYYKRFYSDRSHMRGIVPNEAFPAYPYIQPQQIQSVLTLSQLLDVSNEPTQIMSPQSALHEWFKC